MNQNFFVDLKVGGAAHFGASSQSGSSAAMHIIAPTQVTTSEAQLDWTITVEKVIDSYGEAIKRLADR